MSFTIKCNKCGKEQEIKSKNPTIKNIDVLVVQDSSDEIKGVEFLCENPDCDNDLWFELSK